MNFATDFISSGENVMWNFWEKVFTPKPFDEGYLQVSDKHKIFYHQYGNPHGKVALCLHGGPGGNSHASSAANFNLKKYRVILFDQRGCGKSVPAGLTEENSISDLCEDINRLLNFLNVKGKIVLYGTSWGSTLALYFAEHYPEKIEHLVLSKIFLANADNKLWEEKIAGFVYPDVWEKVETSVPEGEDIPAYYYKLVMSNNRQKQEKAVKFYARYEYNLSYLVLPKMSDEVSDDEIASAKIYIHYAANKFFLSDNELLNNIHKLKKIPVHIIHNRADLLCPLMGAYQLNRALPLSTLDIVPAYGHVSNKMRLNIKKYLKSLN